MFLFSPKLSVVNSILTAAISNSSLNNNNSKVKNFLGKSENISRPEIQNISNSFRRNENKNEISKNLKPSILKRQKSASTEFLNLINPLEENSSCSVKSTNMNESDGKNKSDNLVEKKTKRFNSPRLSPNPPQIQQISGVLSKSLCSIVYKPQPLKPTVNANITSSTSRIEKGSPPSSSSFSGPNNSNKSNNLLRNTTSNKSFLKNKCVSTTNLKFESLANSSFSMYGENKATTNKRIENIKKPANKVSSKSVSFLNKIEKYDQNNEYDFFYGLLKMMN